MGASFALTSCGGPNSPAGDVRITSCTQVGGEPEAGYRLHNSTAGTQYYDAEIVFSDAGGLLGGANVIFANLSPGQSVTGKATSEDIPAGSVTGRLDCRVGTVLRNPVTQP